MYLLIFLAAIFSALGNLIIKFSSSNPSNQGIVLFITGGIAYFCSLLFFKTSLKELPLSVGYPMLATSSMILSSMLAYKFFNESLGVINFVGIFFCCLGITFLSFNS